MTERRLLQIQALSGLVFLFFTLVHLMNTGVAALGVEAYSGFQELARAFYQNPLLEIALLMIPLAIHWTAAVIRLKRDGFRRKNQSLRARLHRYSGYFLLVFIWGHVAATRGPSFFYDVEVGFSTVSFTFAWLPLWFYPYYTLLALAGLYHGINGAFLAASIFGLGVPKTLRYGPGFWIPVGAFAAAILVGLASLSGNLFEIPDPFDSEYAAFMAEMMGE